MATKGQLWFNLSNWARAALDWAKQEEETKIAISKIILRIGMSSYFPLCSSCPLWLEDL